MISLKAIQKEIHNIHCRRRKRESDDRQKGATPGNRLLELAVLADDKSSETESSRAVVSSLKMSVADREEAHSLRHRSG